MSDTRLGPFLVDARIGRGGMGEVWAARHEALDQPVAIKIITRRLASTPRFRAAFTDEVRAVARMRHRAIVEVFDYGAADEDSPFAAGSPYLVMARADGSVRDRPPRSWSELRELLLEVLSGLAHAHAHGVIHLDLKPGNLLRIGHQVAITDFGVAAFVGEAITRNPARGSAAYMAPEQFGGRWRDYSPATDLYALGIVAWELLCGELPFTATDATTLGNLKRTAPTPRLPDTVASGAVRDWLEGMLATEPGDRFQRAADAAAALAEIAPDTPVAMGQGRHAAAETLAWSTLGETTWDPEELRLPTSVAPEATPAPAPVAREWREGDTRPELLHAALGLGLFSLRPPPFVGREAERDRLWTLLVQAAESDSPRAALVHGAQGVGSTRLCTWTARRADELGTGRSLVCEEDDLASFWRRTLLLDGLETDDRVQQLTLGRLALPDRLARAVSALVEPGSSLGRRERVAIQLELLEHLSRDRPLVLALDRLDSDGERGALARAVLQRARSPILLLLTARTEGLHEELFSAQQQALEEAGAVVLGLAPLEDEVLRLLLDRVLRLESRLSARLLDHAAGNPQLAVQQLGAWISEHLLVPGSSGFALAPGATGADLADRGWDTRVLPILEGSPGRRRAAELAAVLGPVVEREVWTAVACDLDPDLLLAVEEDLVHRRLARPHPDGFAFAHPAVRRAILAEADADGRTVRHHRRVADTLEALGPATAWRSGDHRFAGEQWQAAFDALRSSALERWNRQHIQRARAALLRAVDAARQLGPDAIRATRRARVIEAYFAAHSGHLDEAEALAGRAIDALQPGEDDPVLGRAHRARGIARQRRGDFEAAIADLQMAADLFVAGNEPDLACTTEVTWMQCLLQLGRLEEAPAVAARFHPKKPATEASAEGGRGILCAYQEDFAQAVVHFERAREVARAHGLRVAEVGILANLGDALRYLGDLDRAAEMAGEAIEAARSLGLATEPIIRLNRVQLLLARGDADVAWPELELVLDGLERIGRKGMLGAAHAVALRCLAMRGDWDRWEHHFERATALIDETGLNEPEVAEAFVAAADLAERAGFEGRAAEARARGA